MLSVAVTEQSQVADARRQAVGCARSLGFSETDVERVALVATELATNLVRHAQQGEILISAHPEDTGNTVQLIALDDGPGMGDPEVCFRDGYSTAAGAGTGLGAICRLSDKLDLYSRSGAGTAVLARVAPKHGSVGTPPSTGVDWDAVVVPKPGELACGDGWSSFTGQGFAAFLLCDGIGHGPLAADATAAAVQTFGKVGGEPPVQAMQAIHHALAGTRGAAAAIARIDLDAREVRYCGIGNIATTIVGGGSAKKAVSQNGTLGHSVRKIQEFVYPLPSEGLLVMHSDGLATSWDIDGDPGLRSCLPATIASVLYRRHRRGRDDAAVLVAKNQ